MIKTDHKDISQQICTSLFKGVREELIASTNRNLDIGLHVRLVADLDTDFFTHLNLQLDSGIESVIGLVIHC